MCSIVKYLTELSNYEGKVLQICITNKTLIKMDLEQNKNSQSGLFSDMTSVEHLGELS